MRRTMRTMVAAASLAVMCVTSAAVMAQEKEKAEALLTPPEMDEWAKYAQPGEHHRHMAKTVGTWKTHGKMWVAPGAPPQESDGTMTVKSLLGGRFFQSEYRGTFNGEPFEGIGVDGYDVYRQKHVSTWIDSMGTMLLMFEGTCSEGGKVVDMKATFEDAATKKPSYMRWVSREKDDNTMVMESFSPGPDGKEMKNMEIVYTRK